MSEAAPLPSDAAGLLTIDLGALAANWRDLAQRSAPARCGCVIKADAYGIGIEAAAPALYAAGCRVFFVAQIGEGRRARAVLPAAASKARVKTPPVPGAWNPRCEPNGWRVGFYPTRP